METICNVLFGCDTAKLMMAMTQIPSPPNGFSVSLEDNIRFVLDLMEDQSLAEDVHFSIPWVLWSIYNNRNAILYAEFQKVLESVVGRATEEAKRWRQIKNLSLMQKVESMKRKVSKDRWQPPVQGVIKCNINANWRNSNMHCVTSWIARDNTVSVKFHARDAHTWSVNRITAELRCIVWALQNLSDLRFTDIVIGMDCQAAYEAVTKPYFLNSHIFYILIEKYV